MSRLLTLLLCGCTAVSCGASDSGETDTTDGTSESTGTAGPTGSTDATGTTANPGDPTGSTGTTGDPTTTAGDPTTTSESTGPGTSTGEPATVELPPANVDFDYQLGGAYPLPTGVGVVSRDRNDPPAMAAYNICYVNGFQIQPDEESFWLDEHPDLVLRDENDVPVVDQDWDEMLIDIGTEEKRAAVAAIVGEWIAGCGVAGYQAIEIDNLDSYSRSGGRLEEDDNVLAMRLFADAAHAEGLAIAQKNSAELVGRRAEMATDFVVAEECNRYDECDVYTEAYGDHVLVIEYRAQDFTAGCDDFPGLAIVLRDLELVTPDDPEYVFDGC